MRDFLKRRLLTLVVATVLLAAMVLGAASCGTEQGGEETTATGSDAVVLTPENTVGEGQTYFVFEVTHPDGSTKGFTVRTDAKTVGEALLANGLIAGEDGPYGLYVKTVDGETLDYDTHKKYWAFYENGTMAAKGVDSTEITEGAVYAFRAE